MNKLNECNVLGNVHKWWAWKTISKKSVRVGRTCGNLHGGIEGTVFNSY